MGKIDATKEIIFYQKYNSPGFPVIALKSLNLGKVLGT
ncbi:hypothetical protein BMS3Abin17_01213 [archaeon BMS3Abin17]|nr:hypothetical protein BMS3Abin17_01213 [archaeon BMS3Abin17]